MYFFNWSRSAYGGSYAHLGVLTNGSLGVFEGDSSRGAYGVAHDHSGGRGVQTQAIVTISGTLYLMVIQATTTTL